MLFKKWLANFISIIALIISFWGAYTAHKANLLSKEIYNSKTKLLYYSDTSKDGQYLILLSFDKDIVVQSSKVYFPSNFGLKNIEFNRSTPELNFNNISNNIVRIIRNETFLTIDQYKNSKEPFIIPIVVESNYIAQGKVIYDKARYHINFKVFFGGNSSIDANINSISFSEQLEKHTDPERHLNTMWGAAIINRLPSGN